MNTPTTWIVTTLLAAAFVLTRLTLDGMWANIAGVCLAVAAFAAGAAAFERSRSGKDG
ncbi:MULTISPECIES: hypothetical protein [Actinomadura]|uniref:hypothetical protein n=1 Tax=Actinomadura TaxID=1988 RepID=UPI0004294E7F|nr:MULTISPECIES: hypothetical protein [Actinomadura]